MGCQAPPSPPSLRHCLEIEKFDMVFGTARGTTSHSFGGAMLNNLCPAKHLQRYNAWCSEYGPICHLFELILVIHVNTSNETNHFVEHVFVGISRSHGCYHKLAYHAQANMSYHKLTYHGHVRLLIANLRT
jgi:hypothetical protein